MMVDVSTGIQIALICVALFIAACVFLIRRHWRQQRRADHHDVYGPTQAQAGFAEYRRVADGGGWVDEKYRRMAPDGLRSFIQYKVIERLNRQRSDLSRDQFAALILSDKDLDNIHDLCLETTSDHLVNPKECFHPDNSNLGNYMVAHPVERDKHAEVILLDRFDDLLQSFGEEPFLILIFSWLMPCVECTKAIIVFKRWHVNRRVIVVFRSNYPLYSEKVNEDNRKMLIKGDIEVYHVTYKYNLPRN